MGTWIHAMHLSWIKARPQGSKSRDDGAWPMIEQRDPLVRSVVLS